MIQSARTPASSEYRWCVRVNLVTWHDASAISQVHLSRLHQGLQNAGDVRGCFVSLIHHQNAARLDRLHQWGVFIDDDALAHRRLQRQSLYSRVPAVRHQLSGMAVIRREIEMAWNRLKLLKTLNTRKAATVGYHSWQSIGQKKQAHYWHGFHLKKWFRLVLLFSRR